MKTDRYTKVVLTVIALCLVWICIRDVAPFESVHAQGQPVTSPREVVIAGIKTKDNLFPVKISNVADGTKLPVVVTDVAGGTRLPVVVTDVATSDHQLPVKVSGFNAQANPLPVSIESIQNGKRAGQTLPWEALPIKAQSSGTP